mgnify:CR=1
MDVIQFGGVHHLDLHGMLFFYYAFRVTVRSYSGRLVVSFEIFLTEHQSADIWRTAEKQH